MYWIMKLWLLLGILAPLFAIYQSNKGIKMTWREFNFFLFGVFIAGMPFIYLVNR